MIALFFLGYFQQLKLLDGVLNTAILWMTLGKNGNFNFWQFYSIQS